MMRVPARGPLGLAVALIVMAGCALAPGLATDGQPTVDASSSDGPSLDARPTPDLGRLPTPGMTADAAVIAEDLLAAILADAAGRTGIAAAEIHVTRAELVTWPSGALGCPSPGTAYTDALVPGAWVVVEAGDRVLDYRTTERGTFRLCEGAGPGASMPGG